MLITRIHKSVQIDAWIDKKVLQDVDDKINYRLENSIHLPDELEQGVNSGGFSLKKAREMTFRGNAHHLIAVAGDAILYEFLTHVNKSDKIIVKHAGFNHTNNQRKWLLYGKYERVTEMAKNDEDFVEFRPRRE